MSASHTPPTNPARREQLVTLMILAAGLRLRGAGESAIYAALEDQLAILPVPALDPADLDTIASSLATLPPRLATRAIDGLIADAAALPRPVLGRTGPPQEAESRGEGEESALDRSPSPEGKGPGVRSGLPAHFHTAATIATDASASVDWIAEPWAAIGALTAITGRPKIGKTTFLLDLVAAVLAGRPFLGRPTNSALPRGEHDNGILSPASPFPRGEGGQRARSSASPFPRGEGGQGVRSPAVVYLTEQQPSGFSASLARSNLLGNDALSVLFWHEAMALGCPHIVAAAMRGAARSPSPEGKGPGVRSGLTLDEPMRATGVQRPAARRAIDELLATGQISRTGAGKRASPYRYTAPNSFLAAIQ